MNLETFLQLRAGVFLPLQLGMVVAILASLALGGCGRPSGVVKETSDYSYEDVAQQLAAEAAAAKDSTEAVR